MSATASSLRSVTIEVAAPTNHVDWSLGYGRYVFVDEYVNTGTVS